MASSKLRSAKADQGEEMSIDMSPMIDMVFLLLIFFLVNATMIIVKQDPNVDPPVAKSSHEATDANGRIVVNIYKDGDMTNEKTQPIADDVSLEAYIKEERERVEALGYKPMLHLRGDKNAIFKYARNVIRISARAGVDQVMFASYPFARN